jgi:hypothetical protein
VALLKALKFKIEGIDQWKVRISNANGSHMNLKEMGRHKYHDWQAVEARPIVIILLLSHYIQKVLVSPSSL